MQQLEPSADFFGNNYRWVKNTADIRLIRIYSWSKIRLNYGWGFEITAEDLEFRLRYSYANNKISTLVCVHKGKYLINCEQKRNNDETVTKISCFVSITNIRRVLERQFKVIMHKAHAVQSVSRLIFCCSQRNLAEYYWAAITLLKFSGWRLTPNFSRRIYGAGQKFGGYSDWRRLGVYATVQEHSSPLEAIVNRSLRMYDLSRVRNQNTETSLRRHSSIQGGAKNGASLSHCKYSENFMTELRGN